MPVAIITGASKGLGRALAAALAGRGWDLVLDARSAGPLREAAAALETEERGGKRGGSGERGAGRGTAGGRVVALPGDVTDARHRADLVAAARGLGGLDLLVNNASALGAEPLVPLESQPLDGLRAALETNVVAPLGLVQQALPLLRAAPGGAVVDVSSDAAVEAYGTWGGYGASKAALEQLSAVLAVEEEGLRVWWVDPGDMRTDLYAAAEPGEDLAGRALPEDVAPAFLRLLDERPPSGRYTASELLAAASGPYGAASGPLNTASGPLSAASGPLSAASGPLSAASPAYGTGGAGNGQAGDGQAGDGGVHAGAGGRPAEAEAEGATRAETAGYGPEHGGGHGAYRPEHGGGHGAYRPEHSGEPGGSSATGRGGERGVRR